MNIYNFVVKDKGSNEVSLKEYEGKVLLIVNTATKCGLTPQYESLQKLYDKYKSNGFEILDFPCNQFLNQAPENDEEINNFCTLNYGTTFKRFSKIEVNGENSEPLYNWLKEEGVCDEANEQIKKFEKRVETLVTRSKDNDIKWNFEKFLIDKKGNVVKRYSPAYLPKDLEKDIEGLLNQ